MSGGGSAGGVEGGAGASGGGVVPRLRAARLAALAGGAAALVAAMFVIPEHSRGRDLAWSVGVALFVLAIVVNRMIARQGSGGASGGQA